MSPVFRHGRLRLYLLKLLDESPRHGYEIIRMLQDRFLGVYAPSPGTIYPRLARLEEEGLVTHAEVAGKKVYRITVKGREELRARLEDLADLEETITASVRDITREVTEDVRATVRSLREEVASAARDIHGRPREDWAGRSRGEGGGDWAGRSRGEGGGGGAGRAPWADREGPAGRHGWGSWHGTSQPGGCADPHAYRDLERLARRFSRELRSAAWQAQAVSEDAVRALRAILEETMDRIRDEVFPGGAAPRGGQGRGQGTPSGGDGTPAGQGTPGDGPGPSSDRH